MKSEIVDVNNGIQFGFISITREDGTQEDIGYSPQKYKLVLEGTMIYHQNEASKHQRLYKKFSEKLKKVKQRYNV